MIKPLLSGIGIVVLLAWWTNKQFNGTSGPAYPKKPVNIVVPYPAGGGSDTFVRILQRGIEDENLLGQPLAISNIKGGSGTIGSRKVKNAKPNGYWILCSHNAVITAKLSDTVNYGPEAFAPVCLTGTMAMVILVREDAPYADLPALLRAAKVQPRKITFGANQGAPAYFTTLQLQNHLPGAEFSIVSASGGADRYARIMGGHLDAGIFSLSEYIDFRRPDDTPPSENIRALVVLSPERHEAIPEVGCSLEQGIPVYSQNANYWFAPKGTPPEVIAHLSNCFQKALQNDNVINRLREIRVDPVFMSGKEFKNYLKESEQLFVKVAAKKEKNLPNFPFIVFLITVLLFAWVVIDSFFRKGKIASPAPVIEPLEPFDPRYRTAFWCFFVLTIYVIALQSQLIPFAIITAAMIFLIGSLISRWNPEQRMGMIQLALLTALGTDFIFTKIFSVALP
ncbi:MAG: tripartite tricarboxylate transporter substrate binding protein [Verrucomicrobiales bacterium]|nr:tripartite tricarboxylate transporter substrate binding protein [Verrucomicrobiales bacterium]